MAPHSSDELVASCIYRTAGLRWTRTPTRNAGVASPPDVVHLQDKENMGTSSEEGQLKGGGQCQCQLQHSWLRVPAGQPA